MPLRIVRNDITKMETEAIVNTAGSTLSIGDGCDRAIYEAAGYEELYAARKEIGEVAEGEAFITSGMKLPAKYIIHAVSPCYIDGESGEEEKLRACYQNSLKLAVQNGISSIAFPLIATGSFGYPKADGLKVALEEINAFLLENDMDVSLVVFDSEATQRAQRLFPKLDQYVNQKYVQARMAREYTDKADSGFGGRPALYASRAINMPPVDSMPEASQRQSAPKASGTVRRGESKIRGALSSLIGGSSKKESGKGADYEEDFEESELQERIKHISDPFGVYFLYMVENKGMTSVEVQNGAWITKQVYHKIKKFADTYHPDKRTALCLSVGLKLNLDETKDFIGRAGYAFSNAILEDVIWQFSIENALDIYDISDLLEKYGFKPIVDF